MINQEHAVAQTGREASHGASDGEHAGAPEAEVSRTRFAAGGAIPPVLPPGGAHQGQPTASEIAYEHSPNAKQPSAPTGDAWRDLFHADSEELLGMGQISAHAGRHLLTSPDPTAAAASGVIPFGGHVFVMRTTKQKNFAERWLYVIGNGSAGFCEARYVAMNPPDGGARLRLVAQGDTLVKIAAAEYGARFESGNDARLYVQAIYLANKGRPGIELTPIELGNWERALRGTAEQETLKIFFGAKVIAGQSLWIPSDEFVQAHRKGGELTSGQTTVKERFAIDPELANEAGTTLGLMEGSYEATRDLFKGNADMLRTVTQLEAEAFWKVLPVMEVAAKKLMAYIEKFPSEAQLQAALGAYFAKRWTKADQFGRAEFIGEIVGYIGMNVLFAVATGGASVEAELAEGGSDIARAASTVEKVVDVSADIEPAAHDVASEVPKVKAAGSSAARDSEQSAEATTRTGQATTGAVRPRVTEPVQGLYGAVKTTDGVAGMKVIDHVNVEKDGTKVIETSVELPDGRRGYLERAYDPKTKTLTMRNAFLDDVPRWIKEEGPKMDAKDGVPTVTYLTLRQMKLLGVDYAGLSKVEMSTIQNVRGVLEFNVLLREGVKPDVAILKTHSVQYADGAIVQSGHRVSGAKWIPRWKTPLRAMLEHYETSGGRRPPDPTIVAKHDRLIAEYGKGVITRDTEVEWNYDIELAVDPIRGGNP